MNHKFKWIFVNILLLLTSCVPHTQISEISSEIPNELPIEISSEIPASEILSENPTSIKESIEINDTSNAISSIDYNSETITIEMLENNFCFYFDGMFFASDREKNHVFFCNAGKIVEHRAYDIVDCDDYKIYNQTFSSVVGMNFMDTFPLIGIPSYLAQTGSLSLHYSHPYGILYTLTLEYKDDSYYVNEVRSKRKIEGIYMVDRKRKLPVTEEQIKTIEKNMCMDDVILRLGKAFRQPDDEAYEYMIWEYDMEDSKVFRITLRFDQITEECEHAKIYTKKYPHNVFYYYVETMEII